MRTTPTQMMRTQTIQHTRRRRATAPHAPQRFRTERHSLENAALHRRVPQHVMAGKRRCGPRKPARTTLTTVEQQTNEAATVMQKKKTMAVATEPIGDESEV